MKRFHVHVSVEDIAQSTRFYSALFGAPPTVAKPDYAKWMLDDPRINFAISHRVQRTTGTQGQRGINHLGFQVDSDDELTALQSQHEAAALSVFNEGNTQCCYAKSKKHWLTDPQGIAWEMYHSMGAVETYNGDAEAAVDGEGQAEIERKSRGACCLPDASAASAIATARKQTTSMAKCSTACCPAPTPA
jgi:catechol 2,3-dioxygenase-like lactoylglutathione lyase family enzyme